ncbi:glycosyltransferase family 9 protein [Parabacteroides bouchesdurhonensis]|uniref:glycosyltransferase family 9 protein n=1 Tax=Parabacteroides bouchesdurhonensis TaxID=1936995 RepID=UPI000E47D35E|nr:glycosyltransferase family 9 protein [Parabacteroides bouchesdurhonensis]RHJ94119.1 lipopolysaccharide heptosyltransferase family protein [Bacteroides sp. AM07-16]
MKKPIKHILIIRFRRVGDSVLAVPLCTSLKKSFPDVQIDFVLNSAIASLYEGHPDIDKIISFTDEENHSLIKYLSRVRQVMQATKYDVIIDMRSTVKTLFFSLFSLNTPYRIGTKKGYNVLLHNYCIDNHNDNLTDMVQHNLQLLRPLEKEAKITYDPELRLYVDEKEKNSFRLYMEKQGVDFSRPVIFASVVTRVAEKMWNPERMKDVLRRIIDKYQPQIIFNYTGNREEELAKALHKELDNDPHIFTSVRADSLLDLRAMIANCDFFFGNEGGPRHIAQSFGIPSYAIFSPGIVKSVWLPGDKERYQGISPDDLSSPTQQGQMSAQDYFNLITVDDVWKEVDLMLNVYLAKK